MYEDHWKLTHRPFENRIEGAASYYPAESHQAAMLKLRYAIENRRSAALLSGPTGIGKSLLLQILKKQLPDFVQPIVPVAFPALESSQFIRYIAECCSEREPNTASRSENVSDVTGALVQLQRFLTKNIEAQRHAVVILDEAHLLDAFGNLEVVRLLLNLALEQAQGESAWTIVLVGQPQLLAQIHRVPSLDERLAVKCVLHPLTLEETISYVQQRVRAAGGESDRLFQADALERIYVLSQGIPRRINRLGDLALMLGFAEDRSVIAADLIDSVHSDLMPTHAI